MEETGQEKEELSPVRRAAGQNGVGRRTGLKVGEKQVGNYLKSRVAAMCIHVNRVSLIQLYIHHLWS